MSTFLHVVSLITWLPLPVVLGLVAGCIAALLCAAAITRRAR